MAQDSIFQSFLEGKATIDASQLSQPLRDVGFLKTAKLPNNSFWPGNEKEVKVLTECEESFL